MATNGQSGIIPGLGGSIKALFKGAPKTLQEKTEKPLPSKIQPQYPFSEDAIKRCKLLAERCYREGSFEKIQFARKWMRNCLMFQGYHELEWSDVNVSWDVMMQDTGDYAFPNNYYRSLILHGVRAYIQNEPIIEPQPSNEDAEAQAATKAAKTALEVIKQNVHYDDLRVQEAIYLRIMGNSFRVNYYSKDPRYGTVTAPVYEDTAVILSHGGSLCPNCGAMEGKFTLCPACGAPIQGETPPIVTSVPNQTGTVKYPRGEIVTEIGNPLEFYVRSSVPDLWHAPFVVRSRIVDTLALQATFPDIDLNQRGDDGGGEAYATGGDLGLIYLQQLADLPGDPTQYASWYERATTQRKSHLIESWLRPSQYFFDKELIKLFPDGMKITKTGEVLLEAKAETIEDHITHRVYIPVPGRFWGDGDDDLIPGQLKLDETDRLISRNQGYNSSPLLAIDSQRVDKNQIINDPSTIIEVKSNGKGVEDAIKQLESSPLSKETWDWRASHLQDMQFHSKVSPAALGMHEPGVNTFGGQESSAAKSDNALLPQLILWKTADEQWAMQVLKLAAENWLDERVTAVEGINGKWEFSKLKGDALALDKIRIKTRVMPIDPSQQDAMSQAVASGALNPQDPRVQRKMMQLFHLPTELDTNYIHQKKQWEEIEAMKQNHQQIQPTLIMENDEVHISICIEYWNTDECQQDPQLMQIVTQHAQLHMMNVQKMQMVQAAVQGGGQQVQNGLNPQQPQGEPGKPGQQPQGQAQNQNGKPIQAGKRGGQSPNNPVVRQQRAVKGQAAKPHRPQPSDGNGAHVQRQT